MKIRNKGTALEIWDALWGDFQNKLRMVAVDMRRCLQQEHCAEKGDVRKHFSKLRLMREDLALMGHPLVKTNSTQSFSDRSLTPSNPLSLP